MKIKRLNLVVNIVFVVLLLAALMNPHGLAVPLVVTAVWLVNIAAGVLSVCGALVLCLQGSARAKCKALLRRCFPPVGQSALTRFYGWIIKLLIVLTLAFSGWVITLVCYLLAVVVYNLLRHELTETAAA